MKAIEIRYSALPAAFNCPNEALPVSSGAMQERLFGVRLAPGASGHFGSNAEAASSQWFGS